MPDTQHRGSQLIASQISEIAGCCCSKTQCSTKGVSQFITQEIFLNRSMKSLAFNSSCDTLDNAKDDAEVFGPLNFEVFLATFPGFYFPKRYLELTKNTVCNHCFPQNMVKTQSPYYNQAYSEGFETGFI